MLMNILAGGKGSSSGSDSTIGASSGSSVYTSIVCVGGLTGGTYSIIGLGMSSSDEE